MKQLKQTLIALALGQLAAGGALAQSNALVTEVSKI